MIDIDNIDNRKDKKSFKYELKMIYKTLKAHYEVYQPKSQINDVKTQNDNYKIVLNRIYNINNNLKLIKDILKSKTKYFYYFLSKYSEDICLKNKPKCSNCVINKFCKYNRNKLQKSYYKDDRPTVVDLFCGAGGMSLGFSKENFKIVLANDNQRVCTDTYTLNHPEVPKKFIVNDDIKDIVNNIQEYIYFNNVDLVMGGPPCQGFSNANRQRIIDDPRNKLYKYFVDAVSKIQPKYFLMENVRGMKNVADQVIEDFNNVGYKVKYKIFNAKNFSVPQNRERIFFFGSRTEVTPQEIIIDIEKQNHQYFLLEDAISDLKELEPLRKKNSTEYDSDESGRLVEKNKNPSINSYLNLINNDENNDIIFNHKSRYNNDRDIEIFSRMIPGDNANSPRIEDIMPYKNRKNIFKDKYYKLEYNEICKTITAHMKFDCNMYIHPEQPRGLTPREAARVQSFPDDYIFIGPFTRTYMQIGNSVPPLMANCFANVIKNKL